jgi:hypothetical protein
MVFGNPQYTPEDRRAVTCIHCGQATEISARALSANCVHCHKSLRIEEVRIRDYQARRVVETCSTFTVEIKGDLRADSILCAGAVVRGKCRGHIQSTGPVLIGPEAEHVGDVTAPSIAIPEGAVLKGFYRVGGSKAA